MALTEDQERLLWHYHAFLRARGYTVCERVTGADGAVMHRNLRIGRGQDLIRGFEGWMEKHEAEQEAPTGGPRAVEEGNGTPG